MTDRTKNGPDQSIPVHDWSGLVRSSPVRSGLVQSGLVRSVGFGLVWSSLVRSRQSILVQWSGPVWSSLVRSGLVRSSPVRSGTVQSVLVRSDPVRSGLVSGPVRLVWSSLDLRYGPWSGHHNLANTALKHRCSPCFVGRNTTPCWLVHFFVGRFGDNKKGNREPHFAFVLLVTIIQFVIFCSTF